SGSTSKIYVKIGRCYTSCFIIGNTGGSEFRITKPRHIRTGMRRGITRRPISSKVSRPPVPNTDRHSPRPLLERPIAPLLPARHRAAGCPPPLRWIFDLTAVARGPTGHTISANDSASASAAPQGSARDGWRRRPCRAISTVVLRPAGQFDTGIELGSSHRRRRGEAERNLARPARPSVVSLVVERRAGAGLSRRLLQRNRQHQRGAQL